MKGHIKGTDCMQLNKTKQKRREKKEYFAAHIQREAKENLLWYDPKETLGKAKNCFILDYTFTLCRKVVK